MKTKKQFPLLLLFSVCYFFLELHAGASPLMMWRLRQQPERREPIVKHLPDEQEVSSGRSDIVCKEEETKEINEEEYKVPTNDEINAQIARYKSEQGLGQKNISLATLRNFNAAIASAEYAKLCLSEMRRKTTGAEKAAWSELAYYSFEGAQANAGNEIEKAKNCSRAVAAQEDVVRSVHYAVIASSIEEQEVFKNEASYHRWRAMEEMKGNRVEAERQREMAVVIKERERHFLKPSGVETSQQQKVQEQQVEMILRESSTREAEITKEVGEVEGVGDATFAAEQAAAYSHRAEQTENLPEKEALKKAAESSLKRSCALSNHQREEAMHFFMAASYQADGASLFHQANQEVSLDKKREYVTKAQYYLEHAKLWEEHQVEEAMKFSYKKFQQRGLLPPLQQRIPSKNTAYSQFDAVGEGK